MKVWVAQHIKACRWALRRLLAAPMNTVLSLLAIGVALALPAGGQMLLGNALQLARSIGGDSNGIPQISLFLRLDAERAHVDALAARLQAHANVREQHFVSREDALKRMQASEGLAEVIAALPKNPFPDAFIVLPKDDSPLATEKMRAEFARWPKVEHVQLDSAWVRRLDAMLRLGHLAVLLLAMLLGVGLVTITFTTIRLQIVTQRAEIEVSRLLGATDSFIRRPFFYFAALQGLAGGFLAWLIVLGITLLLRAPVADLAMLYNTSLVLRPLALTESLSLLVLSAALGCVGAAVSMGRHLRGPLA